MQQDRILNIPNLLTLTRMIMTPFIVYAILQHEAKFALTLMLIAGVTDMLDGAIARYFNQRSTVGAYMDPLADKLMLVGGFIALFIIDQVPLYLFLAVIFRDVIIIIGAIAYEMVTHKLKMEPTMTSKVTTFMQIVFLVMVLVHMAWPLPLMLLQTVTWLTFAVTCLSGLQYMVVWTQKAVRAENA
jgi:cardiolipin synthase